MARYGVGDFSSFVSCKKSIACLTVLEKRTSEAAWVVAFFNSCGLLAGGIFVRQSLRKVCIANRNVGQFCLK